MRASVFAFVLLVAVLAALEGEAYVEVPMNADMSMAMPQCPAYDDPSRLVMLPFPNDCRRYFTCLRGRPYVTQCPESLFWSQRNYRCDYREYSDCQSPDTEGWVEYSAYPGDCSRFYEKRVIRCPNNHLFNSHSQRCELSQYVNSCESLPPWNSGLPTEPNYPMIPPVIPTAATPEPEYNAPIDAQLLCKNSIPNSYIPFPGDCRKFIYCGPTATVLNCAADSFWNPMLVTCTASSSGCQALHYN
ncbi:uncharacterized protein LOC117893522 [Drosophila subobscura]|uniref:uncharacterized protein LOC117893522 n=1 Tax=Drosophila subobscura TaxID=7241 RepID=UPI00155A87F2|nr:uncharacterized protein LOC117893522 [Drosophila subobscura]